MLKIKYGLKLFSTNQFYIQEAKKYFEKGIYDYIELYIVPGSFKTYSKLWSNLSVPYIIHAPHFAHDFNLAKKEYFKTNKSLLAEAKNYADKLKSKYIIIHPGLTGDYRETIRQIGLMYDSRLIVENKPFIGLNGKRCVGSSLYEINEIVRKTGIGFCLDIGHAIKTAFANDVDPYQMIALFYKLKPKVLHICDGKLEGCFDEHLNLGKGEYDWETILSIIGRKNSSDDLYITIETNKRSKLNLKDFLQDSKVIKNVQRS